jgi:glucose/arabinose dehydrogenase/mono/diheme cytochrome c family protein
MKKIVLLCVLFIGTGSFLAFKTQTINTLSPVVGSHISLIGGNLGSRMINYDFFETELQLRYPENRLTVRNLCDGGDTPGFRPHSARFTPWAFSGAEKFQKELANGSESEGHFDYPDQWLTRLQTDVVIGFFGFSESFAGPTGLPAFKSELQAFIDHTKNQQYNGKSAPEIVLVSPIAYEDLSAKFDVPNGKAENLNLGLYTKAIQEIALKNKVKFVDAFTASKSWYLAQEEDLSIDGMQLNKKGYGLLGAFLADEIYGKKAAVSPHAQKVYDAVAEKNWMWHNDYKVPNGVHVYGRRYNPFGPDNYPFEIEKIRQLTLIRDNAIWKAAVSGEVLNLEKEDAQTAILPEVKTNYTIKDETNLKYLSAEESIEKLKIAPGFKVEVFASEKEFPDLAKPCQMTFDNQGRLWVVAMPSYPHYKPGDIKPNDKILILEDTNNDGKADKQTVFAQNLHVPVGFEISHDGVYISQGTNLVRLRDTNGDDKADEYEIVLSGFDDHDTHHTTSAFTADESGAFIMEEGIFLHTNVETPYGPVRATNGGFYRYNPNRKHLIRYAQVAVPNPWGVAFDKYGQDFFAETSNPDVRWMTPSTIKSRYGESNPKTKALIEEKQRVRPTSGLEFVSSRHFPEELQGDMLINNTIGFLGMKMHQVFEDGTGYGTKHRMDLMVSADKNFRPVDMEFAPDGSLFFIDWHNILIGHMQHNARDPLRDHTHGRVYRITYPGRPLIKPAKVAGADLATLFENLKLHEYRSRYRTRRELRARPADQVLAYMKTWIKSLDPKDPEYEHHLLEAMWVSWGLNKIDQTLTKVLLGSKDHKVRAAAVRAVRFNMHQMKDAGLLLQKAALDPHGRVRLEAFVAASWLPLSQAKPVFDAAKTKTLDSWMKESFEAAWDHVNNRNIRAHKEVHSTTNIRGADLDLFTLGRTLYAKEGNCMTCHQANGMGLPASGFPPLSKSRWVTDDDKERLIKLVLKGLMGPIEVNGQKYAGEVPMTPYGGLMNDKELASVLTFVRNSFGNQASVITADEVKAVRQKTAAKKDLYQSADLLAEHPFK